MRRLVALALVVVLVAPNASAVASDPQGRNDSSHPSIAAVHPNPITDGDAGEFVVLDVPAGTDLEKYRLRDGEGSVGLPNASVAGEVALSTDPAAARNLTSLPARGLKGHLALANGGENLSLVRGNRTVDTLRYTDAPEGERGTPTADGIRWHHPGTTDFDVVDATGGQVRAFALPDAAGLPTEFLESADDRLLVGGYTWTSRPATDALVAAAERGVTVRVLLDADPVGGRSAASARALDQLVAANVSVRLLGGERPRYAFHHAKYAIADDRALVTTENWKPSGTGGHSNRGWGVVVQQKAVVSRLAALFRTDSEAVDARPWEAIRADESTVAAGRATESYPTRFPPSTVPVDRVRLLVAPDNVEREVVHVIDSATDSIDVLQVSVGSRQHPFVRALVRAAERGVRVRLLLSGASYVQRENRDLAERLNDLGRERALPIEARVVDPRSRFGVVHAKGVVVDRDRVLVGSVNWNNNSVRNNREVLVDLSGEAVGQYFTRVFRADWRGGRWRLSMGVAGVAVVAVLVAGLVGRWVRFRPR